MIDYSKLYSLEAIVSRLEMAIYTWFQNNLWAGYIVIPLIGTLLALFVYALMSFNSRLPKND